MTIQSIDLHVRLYLSVDVSEEEASEIVQELDYDIRHDFIDSTDIYDFDMNKSQ